MYNSMYTYRFLNENFGDGNSRFDNNYGSNYRSEFNWDNSGGNKGGRFGGFDNNNQGSSNLLGFNSFTNRGFKSQRSRQCNENIDKNWNKVPQDSSPNMMNGPLPVSQRVLKFGKNQLPSFNEQNGIAYPGGPPTNKLPSLFQVCSFKQ